MWDKKLINSSIRDNEKEVPINKNNPISDIRIKSEKNINTVLSEVENSNSVDKHPLYNIEASQKLLNILTSKDIKWDYTWNDRDILDKVLLKIEELIKEWADPNTKDQKGMNVVQKTIHSTHYGIWETDFRMEQLIKLVQLGAGIDTRCFVKFMQIQKYEFCRKLIKEWFRIDPSSQEDWKNWIWHGFSKEDINLRAQFINIFEEEGILLKELTTYYKDTFIYLVGDGDIKRVKILLSILWNDISDKSLWSEKTALWICCTKYWNSNIEILELLIENWVQDPEWIALIQAAANENIWFLTKLLENKVIDKDTIQSSNFEILASAITNNNIDGLKFLLDSGFDISSRNKEGNTLLEVSLWLMCSWGEIKYEISELVINKFIKDENNKILLEKAITDFISNKRVFTENGVRIILKFRNIGINVDINNESFFYNGRKLESENFNKFVKFLKDRWIMELIHNPNGLLLACAHQNNDLIKYLVEQKKVDIDCVGTFDYTPLIVASKCKDTTTAKLLLKLWAKHINEMGDGNFTPLLTAANEWNVSMVNFLLNNGAEVINDGQRVIRRLSDYDIHDTDQQTANQIISIVKEHIAKENLRNLWI